MLPIDRLNLELEDIRQDLDGLLLNISDCKISDFGCGDGYKTLGLMLDRDAAECTGVDIFTGKDFSPSLKDVQQRFVDLKATILAMPENSQENKTIRNLRHLLREGRWAKFLQDDILNPQNLPNNLDLVYCNKFLRNIYSGLYNNSPKHREGVTLAINNMLGCVRNNGLICLVEEGYGLGEGDDSKLFFVDILAQIMEHAQLIILDEPRAFSRHIIGEHGRVTKRTLGMDFGIENLVVYHARKL